MNSEKHPVRHDRNLSRNSRFFGHGRPRSLYVDVDERRLDDEIAFLRTEIYLRDLEPRA
jgi:hypothetical protein